jgi:glutathione S-transferase
MLTLYQAEWCPYSAAVRERLTELGIDFVARQVEPRERERLAVGEIPTLETEDGLRFEGTAPIFAYLSGFPAWEHERAHRAQYRAHARARREDVTARILESGVPLSSRRLSGEP